MTLPVGDYSLLFRIDSQNSYSSSYALDDVSINSCDYPTSNLTYDGALLTFSCDFDNGTLCSMQTQDRFSSSTYNFTIYTAETIPNKQLGPSFDHTLNSSTGGFAYWDREYPFSATDSGKLFTLKPMESNLEMCIKFAYYVNSSVTDRNGTSLWITSGGCFGSTIWSITLDDSQGWQVVQLRAPAFACMETYYFGVYQTVAVAVSVAFDDIDIGQCGEISPSTTTTTTATTSETTTLTTAVISTESMLNTSTSTSATSMIITSTVPQTSPMVSTMMTTTSYSHSSRLSFVNGLIGSIILLFLTKMSIIT